MGKGKTSFHEKRPNVGTEVFPFPKPQPFSRKAAYFVKWKAAPGWRLSTRMRNRAFKKSGVFCDCTNLPVWPDTQPLTHPLPVRGTSSDFTASRLRRDKQGGKAAVFTSSLQSASFATSHPLGGVFCKVESSPLLEIIYPYGEQSLQEKRDMLLRLVQYRIGNYLPIYGTVSKKKR